MQVSSSPHQTADRQTLAAAGQPRVHDLLAGPGVSIDYGTATVRVRSPLPSFAADLTRVYADFPLLPPAGFSDVHVDVLPGSFWRRLVRPQVTLVADRQQPFEPFPVDGAFPMFEWGVNWFVAQRFQQYLLLHAGVVADADDRALILAAPPGSGKSTLTADLMLHGFRLLSDEFGVLDPSSGMLLPMLKPVALKNEAIDVITRRTPSARVGPLFRKTRKGDVAHVAPTLDSIAARHRPAHPAAIVFPRYVAGSPLEERPVRPAEAFTRLAFNSFNYAVLGPRSFDALTTVAATTRACELVYSDLDAALARIGALLSEGVTADA
jgi:HprK-related kinase A